MGRSSAMLSKGGRDVDLSSRIFDRQEQFVIASSEKIPVCTSEEPDKCLYPCAIGISTLPLGWFV
jgi:hypothetical protein